MHRIAIVETKSSARKAFRAQIDASGEFRVVGEASDLVTGMALVCTESPDLVIVDLDLPNNDGLRLLWNVQAFSPDIRLLARSACIEPAMVSQAVSAGVRGFVEKSQNVGPAMRALVSGYCFFPENTVNLKSLMHPPKKRRKRGSVTS